MISWTIKNNISKLWNEEGLVATPLDYSATNSLQ